MWGDNKKEGWIWIWIGWHIAVMPFDTTAVSTRAVGTSRGTSQRCCVMEDLRIRIYSWMGVWSMKKVHPLCGICSICYALISVEHLHYGGRIPVVMMNQGEKGLMLRPWSFKVDRIRPPNGRLLVFSLLLENLLPEWINTRFCRRNFYPALSPSLCSRWYSQRKAIWTAAGV